MLFVDGTTPLNAATFNAMQAELQLRTEKGAVNGYAGLDGTGKVPAAQLPAASGPGAPALTLPGSPVNGQQALLTDSLTAPTWIWLFQYNTAITDANKWVCIGGAPAVAQNGATATTQSTVYVDPANNASFTVPRAGIYVVTASADPRKESATDLGGCSICLSVAGVDITPLTESGFYSQATFLYAGYAAVYNTGAIANAAVIKLRFKSAGALNFTLRQKVISVVPVRVA